MLGDYESSGSFVFSLLPQIVCAVEIKLTVRYPWPETRSLLLLVVAHGQLGARHIDITMKTRLTLETESVLFQCVFVCAWVLKTDPTEEDDTVSKQVCFLLNFKVFYSILCR